MTTQARDALTLIRKLQAADVARTLAFSPVEFQKFDSRYHDALSALLLFDASEPPAEECLWQRGTCLDVFTDYKQWCSACQHRQRVEMGKD